MKNAIPMLLALLMALGASCKPADQKPPETQNNTAGQQGAIDTTFTPEVPEGGRLLSGQGWHLVIEYRAKGTRSEGQNGALYRGREAMAGKEGDEIDTPLGRMKHYGDHHDQMWEPTGWNFADKTKIKNSRDIAPEE